MSRIAVGFKDGRTICRMTPDPLREAARLVVDWTPGGMFTLQDNIDALRAALAASGATLTDYQRGYVDGFDAPRNIEARAASGATLDVDRIARAFREAQLEDWRGRNYTDAHEWAEAIVEADARLSGAVITTEGSDE